MANNYVIQFDNCSAADANRYAQDLQEHLQRKDIDSERKRTNDESMNVGDTLVIMESVIVLAKVGLELYHWMMKHHQARITIRKDNGEVVVENLDAAAAEKLAELLSGSAHVP